MRIVCLFLLIVCGALLPLRAAHAASSYDGCTSFVSTLPAVITTPGTWCLNKNLTYATTSGTAISITANDVVLDCNDFVLDGSSAGLATTTTGIGTTVASDVTIRHCDVTGFYRGIALATPAGTGNTGANLVEDNLLSYNTTVSIQVIGDDSLVRRNVVQHTGGSTVSPSTATGISVSGNVDLFDNSVSGVVTSAGSSEAAIGIYEAPTYFADLYRNHISSVTSSATGIAYGIDLDTVTRAVVEENTVSGNNGQPTTHAIECSTSSNDRLRNNVFTGSGDNSLGGCGDATGNVLGP